MKPVRLPAAATLALPRWGLIALCLLYILPGIVRRDPWKTDDAAGFGIMWTMAHGSIGDWLVPNIVGLAMPHEGPLAFWIGAVLIKLFGWLTGDALAARLSTLIFFAIGAASVWRTAYVLGRRHEAQPLQLAFGGQPAPRDYGRTLADGALLIYIACLGLLLRSHETAAPALHVALTAATFYAGACLFDKAPGSAPWRAALALGATLGLLTLTRGWTIPLTLFMTMLLLALLRDRALLLQIAGISAPIAVALPLAWAGALQWHQAADVFGEWLHWNSSLLAWPSLHNTLYLFKNLPWFTWPAWPIAAWAVYAWRRHAMLHILLPGLGVMAVLLVTLCSPRSLDIDLLSMLPPLAILATFGLPTLKRGTINAVDWFSVMTLTALAIFTWLGWIAKQTGWPAQLAKNAFKLAPGFKPEFNLFALLIALAATIGWGLLLRWRLARRPAVLWRAVVLSSGGVILCWLLLMTLWLPWLNYGRSYAGVAGDIASKLPDHYRCVATNGVGPAQRASFAYLGKVRFAHDDKTNCDYLLVQDNDARRRSPASMKKTEQTMTLLWQGRRTSDRKESFRLFQLSSP
jgi:4-amino-4-deoxy-L-arabinose transferase-like glycosyltransferase